MLKPQIEPHKITTPIQLLAVWFAALVLVVGALLGTAAVIDKPSWVCPMLSIAAVFFIPIFLVAAFVMQTRFRPHLQEDHYYADWLNRKEQRFADFKPENINVSAGGVTYVLPSSESPYDLESRRIARYEVNHGLFLVHDWRPSIIEGQVADIVIWLHQHGEGPLSEGAVERVQYQLGPKFFSAPVDKYNTSEKFKLEVSAYGPMLCVANVFLKGHRDPIFLERYIYFEEAP